MDACEFESWQAYFQVEPWGVHAMEILNGEMQRTIYHSAGAKNIPDLYNLMPFHSAIKRASTPSKSSADIEAQFMAKTAAIRGMA
jgi:hypothetical protein